MLEKCIFCNSSGLIEQIVLVESSEARDSEDSSDSVNSEDSKDIESENDAAEVKFYRWQTIDKKTKKYQSYD